ncbi:hypothetical protein C8Q76DRAFT_780307 [Earliella scabrosa]|nr:hypothetical protein C8Q76DRAFT_780307 [Earliella scabrosa]
MTMIWGCLAADTVSQRGLFQDCNTTERDILDYGLYLTCEACPRDNVYQIDWDAAQTAQIMSPAAHVHNTSNSTGPRPGQVIPPLRQCSRPSCVSKFTRKSFDGRLVPSFYRHAVVFVLAVTSANDDKCMRVVIPRTLAIATVQHLYRTTRGRRMCAFPTFWTFRIVGRQNNVKWGESYRFWASVTWQSIPMHNEYPTPATIHTGAQVIVSDDGATRFQS